MIGVEAGRRSRVVKLCSCEVLKWMRRVKREGNFGLWSCEVLKLRSKKTKIKGSISECMGKKDCG